MSTRRVSLTGNRTVSNRSLASIRALIIHWWDLPSTGITHGGVVSWFLNRSSQVSAHYVASDGLITQMVREKDIAWHALQANPDTIGLELSPYTTDGDYQTAAECIADIWTRAGRVIPLEPHSRHVSTSCPGDWSLTRLHREASAIYNGTSPVLEGEVMTSAYDVWAYGNDSVQDGRQVFNMLHRLHSDILYNRDYDYVNSDPTSVRHQIARAHEESRAGRRMDDRRLDYVNPDNPTTARHQVARSHQYSLQGRNEASETKAMVKAMASTLDELLDGQGKILKAVEEAETQVVKANAAEVAAELEITTKEDD